MEVTRHHLIRPYIPCFCSRAFALTFSVVLSIDPCASTGSHGQRKIRPIAFSQLTNPPAVCTQGPGSPGATSRERQRAL